MKVLKNYAYNLSYQLLVIVLPIITTPYVTRIFSSKDLGTYGYFNSIVTYFILLATLGVANYGTKEISSNRKEIRKNFWGIYTLQLIATFLSLLISLGLAWYQKEWIFLGCFRGWRIFVVLRQETQQLNSWELFPFSYL